MIQKVQHLYYKYQKFIHYVAIGLIGIVVDGGIFLVLFNLLNIPAVPANLISGSLAITNNFLWNARFNFKKTDRLLQRFISFSTIGVIGMIATTAILFVGVNLLGMNANIVKLVVQAIIISAQFNLNKKLSFKD